MYVHVYLDSGVAEKYKNDLLKRMLAKAKESFCC